ncbi:hypothetical protein KBD59_03050 [Candidatus Gracilibacteria bacterium]|nr:hypothetical protein [Candidatus Gracilibacteria bacterium]
MRYLTFFVVLQCAVCACSDSGVHQSRIEAEVQEGNSPVLENFLCIDFSDAADELQFSPRLDPSHGPCDDQFLQEEVVVHQQAPFSLELYGQSGLEYCIEVLRTSGYITISHERGVVHRDGDYFTWCVTPAAFSSLQPEKALIRSFTASATVTVSVW